MSSAEELINSLENISATSFSDEAERIRARDALFAALRRVQSPWEIAWDQNWTHGATNAAVKTFIDAGVFKKWIAGGGGAKRSAELADMTGMEEQLIRRLIRHLAGQHLVTEIAEDTYAPTPWCAALAASDPPLASVYGKFYADMAPTFINLPSFLKHTGYRNPTDTRACNMQHWTKSDDDFFQHVARDPELFSEFHDAMECHSRFNLTPWPKVYPTETIVANAKPGRALVVDVGGSKGHDLEKFRLCHPEIPEGSLILQDLPGILAEVKLHKVIEPQVYDFFTPQPVKGARVYFMHNVLHDWTDEVAVQILKNVAGGMERGYSRMLIHESLVSNVKPLARVTTSDLTMMAILAAKERSENEWRALVEEAGLKIIKIWRPAQSVESVIEAELA
ncbi:O-methyltransferase af390-400 [Cladobotryum mycophilum]|uniref:O-methyltransferase af390-400 n=1 Tax=Cladobotryum mycophilum TaxID=491253 RepID=A0ABR0SZX3_9HYPO